MARAKTGKSAIERAKRQEQVLHLRLTGASIREISSALDIPKTTVQRLAADAIEDITHEPATQVVEMELQRLDRLQRAVWADAVGGDVKALDRVLKIMAQRAKYLGLEQIGLSDSDEEARDALDKLMTAIINSVPDEPE
jgi:DNA-binding transcriptional MerR regulator